MRSKNQEHFTLLESFIDSYIDSQGVSPSTREIAAGTGLSPSTVSRYLSYMRDNGMIDYVGQRNIITQRKRMTSVGSNKVPLLGAVSCGIPKFAEGNIEEYVQLPTAIFGKGDFFLLRASGDSMIEAGILDGDKVIVRPQPDATNGDIVIALIEDEATCKRFRKDQSGIWLLPENPNYAPIDGTNAAILGKVKAVLREY